ncbi:MAG: alpha/beta hydrolase, partial [Comamonadaceae bacterium]
MTKTLIAAALSLFAMAGAHAETYEGVLQFQGQFSRAEVQTQAVAKAHAPNQNIPAHAVSMGALQNARDRASVQADAVAAAHDPR